MCEPLEQELHRGGSITGRWFSSVVVAQHPLLLPPQICAEAPPWARCCWVRSLRVPIPQERKTETWEEGGGGSCPGLGPQRCERRDMEPGPPRLRRN